MATGVHPGPARHAENVPHLADAALSLSGFSAVVGQIVLMRALIVVFNGNEISLGIMLAAWLLWTAAGSALASASAGAGRSARRRVASLECLLAAGLPASLWALSAAKSRLSAVPGALLGPVPIALASLVSLSLFCLAAGALFVAAAGLCQRERGLCPRQAASAAYLLEAAGSCLGGVLASLLLLRFCGPFEIAGIVALLNVSMAFVLVLNASRGQIIMIAAAAAVCAAPLLFVAAPKLERAAQARLWHGFQLAGWRDSIYGNLVVTTTGEMRSIYSNGMLLANAPDEEAAEEAIHYALLEDPAPRRVLLVGGGINGAIAQALKHPTVERIDYVELDPALIDVAHRYFPAQTAALTRDPRVHLHLADGRAYLRGTKRKFDAIVLDVPGPQTAQLNRFYTVEFFRAARAHLDPDGILALELRSSEETIGPDLADFLRCMQRTLSAAFPYTAAIPGGIIHLFGATRPGLLTEDPRTLIARLQERKLQTQYVREYFIPFRMMPDRMDQMRDALAPRPSTPVNRDFAPAAYFFDVVLWSTQFNANLSRGFRAAARIPFARILAATAGCLLLLATLLACAPARVRRPAAAWFSEAATGFTLMALQVFLLLAFQSIYGYVYHQLAILIGLGMAGIALGSGLALRRDLPGASAPCRQMAWTQLLLASAGPVLIGAASLLARLTAPTGTWIAAQLLFPALAALAGALGGFQFPIANAVYFGGTEKSRSLGTLYAVDLLGGCVGALLLSTYLIPVFGFWKTAWLCAAINLAPALLAARVARGERAAA